MSKISQYSPAATLTGVELIPVVQGGDTKTATPALLLTYTFSGFGANTFPARSSSGALAAKPITDFALTLLDDADAATARTTLGAQALDGTLTALAGQNWAANSLPIGSAPDTVAQVAFAANTFPARGSTGNLVAKTITDFGLGLVDDANAAAARATIGLELEGAINGLQMVRVSNTALTVKVGQAYIPGLSAVLKATSDIAKSSLALSASTWYHVYLYSNSGTPDIEIVTTAPVAYSGYARQKTGDATRRYVGSIRTDGSSNILPFVHHPGDKIIYTSGGSGTSPYRVLSGGTATSDTAVSLTGLLPVTSELAYLSLIQAATASSLQIKPSAGAPVYATVNQTVTGTISQLVMDVPAPSQAIVYMNTAGSGNSVIDTMGYTYSR